MTFAITGANGFLGVHIIHHLLLQGHKVVAIIRPDASLNEFELVKAYYSLSEEKYNSLSWKRCELYDVEGLIEVMENTDQVMHLAGMISYLQRDYDRMLLVNQEFTANVVNACLATNMKKLLYCSSIAAITKSDEGKLISEDVEWNNEVAHSNYGYTKHLGEYEIWRGQEEGLKVVAINPGIILGYGDWTKGSNKLFGNAKNGFPFYSEGVTGWVGVKDVARIAELLCLSNISGERYIVVSENKSFRAVADLMANALNSKKPRIALKGLLYNIIYALIAVKEFLGLGGMLSKETLRSSIAVNYFDNSKLQKELKFEYQTIEEVIKDSTNKKSFLA